MSETTSAFQARWGWRCAGRGCDAREDGPFTNETAASRPASEHSRSTGHLVSWGLLAEGGRIR